MDHIYPLRRTALSGARTFSAAIKGSRAVLKRSQVASTTSDPTVSEEKAALAALPIVSGSIAPAHASTRHCPLSHRPWLGRQVRLVACLRTDRARQRAGIAAAAAQRPVCLDAKCEARRRRIGPLLRLHRVRALVCRRVHLDSRHSHSVVGELVHRRASLRWRRIPSTSRCSPPARAESDHVGLFHYERSCKDESGTIRGALRAAWVTRGSSSNYGSHHAVACGAIGGSRQSRSHQKAQSASDV
jgi:hypothetical protein